MFFANERDVLDVGVETVGTDVGQAITFDPPFPNHYLMHGSGKLGLASLCNVDQLPPTGAIVIAAPLKIVGGSGSPLRVIAITPWPPSSSGVFVRTIITYLLAGIRRVYDRQIMGKFRLLAHPLWVNLLLLIPLAVYFAWRNKGIQTPRRQLLFATIFAVAFGFVEAAVAIYLSAAAGLLPGYTGTLSEVQSLARATQPETLPIDQFPQSLLTVEVLREAATIVMLVGVALLAAGNARERCAVFLWSFAFWDISYYAGLWATIRWPTSLIDLDLLFLIPVPWVAQVWFPLLVSLLTLVAVVLSRRNTDVSGFPELPKTLVVRSSPSNDGASR